MPTITVYGTNSTANGGAAAFANASNANGAPNAGDTTAPTSGLTSATLAADGDDAILTQDFVITIPAGATITAISFSIFQAVVLGTGSSVSWTAFGGESIASSLSADILAKTITANGPDTFFGTGEADWHGTVNIAIRGIAVGGSMDIFLDAASLLITYSSTGNKRRRNNRRLRRFQ